MPAVETPRKKPSSVRPPRNGDPIEVETHRTHLMPDVERYVVHCQVDPWLAYYDENNQPSINEITKILREDGVLTSDGWVPFGTARERCLNEKDTFDCVGDIVAHIARAAHEIDKNFKPAHLAESTWNSMLSLEVAGFRSFPDWRAFVRFQRKELDLPAQRRNPSRLAKDGGTDAGWEHLTKAASDTSMIGEFKIKNTEPDRRDNERKIISAANHLLYNDPRRDGVHGMTIEERNLRLWHFNRSRIAVSDDIDIDKRPDALISFLLFALTADTRRLGFDESVQRCVRRGEDKKEVISFQMRVGAKVYETVGPPISDEAAYHIIGRATRVWQAKEVLHLDNGVLSATPCVIKDVWLFEDAQTEREIQNAIFAKLGDDEAVLSRAKNHFLTFIDECIVPHGQPPPVCLLESREKAGLTPLPGHSNTPGSESRQASRDMINKAPGLSPPVNRQHTPRKHVRSAVEEVCSSVYEVTDYRSLVKCLFGAALALRYMFKAGFVHRDVSAGNCLFYDVDGRGKLADLEYAKPYGQLSASDPKTGTPDFMAVEYQGKNFYFTLLAEPAPSPKEVTVAEGDLVVGSEVDSGTEGSIESRTEGSIESRTESSVGSRLGGGVESEVEPGAENKSRDESESDDEKRAEGQTQLGTTKAKAPALVFTVNFLHDLESIVWIYLWFLHFRSPLGPGMDGSACADSFTTIRSSARSFFSVGIDGSNQRRDLLTLGPSGSGMTRLLEMLKPLYSGAMGILLKPLDLFAILVDEYRRVERSPQTVEGGHRRFSESTFSATIHHDFIRLFNELLAALPKGCAAVPLEELLKRRQGIPSLTAEGSSSLDVPSGGLKRSGSDAGLDGADESDSKRSRQAIRADADATSLGSSGSVFGAA